jgi:hypothetical protein
MAEEERQYQVDIQKCIDKKCNGEVYEIEYMERFNWITAVYKCSKCGREFTVKIES